MMKNNEHLNTAIGNILARRVNKDPQFEMSYVLYLSPNATVYSITCMYTYIS